MPFIPKSIVDIHPLYDNEITEFAELNNIKPFKIYSRDSDKDIIPNGEAFYVINLDDEDGMGTHWCALYSKNKLAYYYDPFGLPCPNEVLHWAKNQSSKKLFYIDNQHQPNDSELCGYFVCYYLYSMNKGMPIEAYMKIFDDMNDGPDEDLNDYNDEDNDEKLLRLMHIGTEDEAEFVVDKNKDKDSKKGKGFDVVKKLNQLLPNAEFHLRDIKFNDYGLPIGTQKHSFTGPNTNLDERIGNIDELMKLPNMEDIKYDKIKYITEPVDDSIDRGASEHDLHYSWIEANIKDENERLKMVHQADKILQEKALNTMKNGKQSIQKRIQGAIVSLVMSLKRKVGVGIKRQELMFLKEYEHRLNPAQKKIFAILTKNE